MVTTRIIEGDAKAFVELTRQVTRHLASWRAFDFRADWDDLVQEVVIATLDCVREDRLEDRSKLGAYIRRTTRFKFIDRIRTRQREAPDAEPEEALDHGTAAWPADRPLEADARVALWRGVDRLEERQRVAVVEVHAKGKTYAEVSKESGIPVGTLKRAAGEGLAALSEMLART